MYAVYCFKVFGLAEDFEGNPDWAYVSTNIKDKEGNVIKIDEQKYYDGAGMIRE